MKTLHDMFLQTDKVKEQLIEHGVVEALCELFYPPVHAQLALVSNCWIFLNSNWKFFFYFFVYAYGLCAYVCMIIIAVAFRLVC